MALSYTDLVERFCGNKVETGFGLALQKARIKQGLTQQEAARLAGIDPGTLARWERSEHQPPRWMRPKLDQLCNILAVENIEAWYTGEGN